MGSSSVAISKLDLICPTMASSLIKPKKIGASEEETMVKTTYQYKELTSLIPSKVSV